mgnify:CR=1 FL=1
MIVQATELVKTEFVNVTAVGLVTIAPLKTTNPNNVLMIVLETDTVTHPQETVNVIKDFTTSIAPNKKKPAPIAVQEMATVIKILDYVNVIQVIMKMIVARKNVLTIAQETETV